jgi:hypothetical protein
MSEDFKGTYNCKFVNGEHGNKYCLLFEDALYSSDKWILKCDKCLELSKVGD